MLTCQNARRPAGENYVYERFTLPREPIDKNLICLGFTNPQLTLHSMHESPFVCTMRNRGV